MNRHTLKRINNYLAANITFNPAAIDLIFGKDSCVRTEDVTYTKEDARVSLADNQEIEGYNIQLGDLFECLEIRSKLAQELYMKMLVHTAHNDIEGFTNESN